MDSYKEKDYKVFEMFDKQWAVVTAGEPDNFNSCTVGWGSLGTIWSRDGKRCSTVTVYVHPARYTSEFLTKSEFFTVSFYPEQYRKAVAYIGTHTGRFEDKAAAAGLTPVTVGKGISYEEANLTFVCKKLYQHQFSREDLAPEIQEYYASMPRVYPDFKGGWQPHLVFVGEIIECIDKR